MWLKKIYHRFLNKYKPRLGNQIIFRRLIKVNSFNEMKLDREYEPEEMETYEIDESPLVCELIYQCLLRNEWEKVKFYNNGVAGYFRWNDECFGECELSVRKHGMYSMFIAYDSMKKYDISYLEDLEKYHKELADELKILIDYLKNI